MASIRSMFGAQDMTVGSPTSCLVKFSIPLLVGNIAQQLYNTVDSIVVGKFIGDSALAAVGACGAVTFLVMVFFVGVSSGASIMSSQYFGAKRRDDVSGTIGTALTITLIISLLLMVAGIFGARPLLELLQTPADIIDDSSAYLTIYFIGIAGCAYYNIISGLLRGLGDSMMPLIFLLVATGLNTVLDIVFVANLGWGVAGVAWATIIAQGVSAILCIFRICMMKKVLDVNLHTLKIKKRYLSELIKLGLPSGITQAVFSLAAVIVQSLTNSFGSTFIAVNTVVMRVDGFAMMPNFTFGIAMSTFAGQNMGAGKLDRVHEGVKKGMKLGLTVSVIMVALILIFGPALMSLFTNTQEVIDTSAMMMRILAVGYVAMAVTQLLGGVIRGSGDTVTPMWISMVTTVALRVPIAYGIAALTRTEANPNGNSVCIFISLLSAWVCGAVLTSIMYKKGKWRTKGLVKVNAQPETAGE